MDTPCDDVRPGVGIPPDRRHRRVLSSGGGCRTTWWRWRRSASASLIGIIPAGHAFEGFSDDVVDHHRRRPGGQRRHRPLRRGGGARCGRSRRSCGPPRCRCRSLVGGTMLLSMVTKNVGALAIFMPVAIQLARRNRRPPRPADADGVRLHARRHRHPGRHLAQHPGGQGAHGRGRASRSACSTSRRSGLRSPPPGFVFLSVRLAAAAAPGARQPRRIDAAFTLEDYTAEARVPPARCVAGRTRRRAGGDRRGRRAGRR